MTVLKTKILIGPSSFGETSDEALKLLDTFGFKVVVNPYKRKYTKDELIRLLGQDVLGIIAGLETLDQEVFAKTKIKVISRCGSGMSNVDVTSARAHNIKVYSTPDGPTNAVAELTLGAMLSLLRMIPVMDRELHDGRWSKKIGHELRGKIVAIIGFGRIGRKLSEMLKPFDVKILAVDPMLQEKIDCVSVVTLPEALRQADIISLHLSGEKEIIGVNELKLVKRGVFLLNAARGDLINEVALKQALDDKKIAGVWLDTFLIEPYNGELAKYPQVVLTPHVGSYTVECRNAMELEAAQNLIKGFRE